MIFTRKKNGIINEKKDIWSTTNNSHIVLFCITFHIDIYKELILDENRTNANHDDYN
jgi:hypothetical protein